MLVIGFLGGADLVGYAPQIEALRLGFRDYGYVEGRTRSRSRRSQGRRHDHSGHARRAARPSDMRRREVIT